MKIFLLLIFCYLWFLNAACRAIVPSLLPLIEDEFHLSHALAGSLAGSLSAGYTLTLILAGFISLRIGYKWAIVAGMAIVSTMLFLSKFATGYLPLVVLMLFVGVGGGVYKPNGVSLITMTIARKNWGKAIAAHDTAGSVSIFLIPILAAVGLRIFGWRDLLLLLGVASLMGLMVFTLFAPNPRSEQGEERSSFFSILSRRDFQVIAVLWIFATCCSMGLYSVIPLFLVKERGIPLDLANTLFGMSRVGGILITLLAGVLADRYGVKRMILLGSLSTGLSTMGLALSKSFPVLVTMLFLQATISNLIFPVVLLVISKFTTAKERSLYIGLVMAGGALVGICVMPIVLGAVADVWNFRTGIFILGLLTAFSCFALKYLRSPL
jgi:MFS transporter, NNP family, nitrate/nitrite transporter